MAVVSQVLLALAGIFLIIVVLLQRGRGGGLAGAFGGLGGQSAFGTKAGDVFTKITVGIAIVWVVLAGVGGYFLRAAAEQRGAESFEDNVQQTDGDEGAGDESGEGDPEVLTAPELGETDESSAAGIDSGASEPSGEESGSPAGDSGNGSAPDEAPDTSTDDDGPDEADASPENADSPSDE